MIVERWGWRGGRSERFRPPRMEESGSDKRGSDEKRERNEKRRGESDGDDDGLMTKC